MKQLTIKLKAVFFCLALLGAWSLAQAAPPQKVNFQGRLTDLSDNPLNGTYSLTFSLYSALTGGTQMWTETQSGVSIVNGAVDTELGSVTPVPYSAASASAYLEIQVDGETLTPRQPFNSVLYSYNTYQLGGLTAADFVNASSSQAITGVKTFSANPVFNAGAIPQSAVGGLAAALVNGPNWDTAYAWGNHAAAGYASAASVSASTNSLQAQIAAVPGDNLGSHTATQALNMAGYAIANTSSMTVSGPVLASGFYGDGSGLTGITASGSVQKTGDTMTGSLALVNSSTLTVTGSAFSVGGSTLVIRDGKVGIGKAPVYPLDVAGRAVITDQVDIWTMSGPALLQAPSGTLQVNAAAGGDIALQGNGVQRAIFKNTGNVGIGTASPAYRLVVSSGAGETGTIFAVATGTANVVRMTGLGDVYAVKFYGDGSGLSNIPGDGLGGHVASTNLNMSSYSIINALNVSAGSLTVGMINSSGAVTAVNYYGDGSALTGITGDNLGSHTATMPLNMGGYGITGVSSMTMAGLAVTGGYFSVANGTAPAVAVQNGNLGLGTATPGQNATAAYGRIMHVYDNTPGVYPGIFIEDNDIAPGARWFVHGHGDGRNSFAIRDDVNAFEPLYIEGADIGIGTDDYTPLARLHVLSSAPVQNIFLASNGPYLSTIPRFVVKGNGNVGIGTESPLYQFVIDGTTGYAGAMMQISTGGAGVITMYGNGDIYAGKYYGDGSGLTGLTASGDNLGNHTATQQLNMGNYGINSSSYVSAAYFYGNGSQLTNIAATGIPANILVSTINATVSTPYGGINITTNTFISGNVGIGTAWSGGYRVRIDEGDIWGDNPELNLLGVEGSLYLTGPLQAASAAGDWNNYVLYGKMGIGTAFPGAKFEVIGGSSTFRGSDAYADVAAFGSESGEFKVVISTRGNVGIGQVSPAARLDIVSGGDYAQIWRDAGGLVVASMTSSGMFTASSMPGDNLGGHTATQHLNMAGYGIVGVSSLTVSGNISAAGNLAIGVSNPVTFNIGAGAGDSFIAAPGNQSLTIQATREAGLGNAFQVQTYNAAKNAFVDRFAVTGATDTAKISMLNSNVGIGTADPSNQFVLAHGSGVMNKVFLDGTIDDGSVKRIISLSNTDGSNYGGYLALGNAGSPLTGPADGATVLLSGAPNQNSYISVGNVGIGTTTPDNKLSVEFTGNNGIKVNSTSGNAPHVKLFQTGTEKATFHANSTTSYIGTVAGAGSFQVISEGAAAITAYTNGNVGVGTAVPVAKLDVAGGIVAASSITAQGGFFGDGSGLSNLPGDDLGNHTAIMALNMGGNNIVSVGSMTIAGAGLKIASGVGSQEGGIYISTTGQLMTVGLGNGTYEPATRGKGSVDLQTKRILGTDNVAAGDYSTIAGGESNKVLGAADHAFIGAGDRNAVSAGQNGVVAGGYLNALSGSHGFIGGGYNNTVGGPYGTIGGGQYNTANSQQTTIAGGYNNSIDAFSNAASILGGSNNSVSNGFYAAAGGFFARSNAYGAFTWADSQGQPLDNNVADRTVFKNRGGFMVTGSTNTNIGTTVNRGVFFSGNGKVGISTGAPAAALDVAASAADAYVQVWRDSGGVVVASMSAAGALYGSTPFGDNLGNHTATQALQMGAYAVNSSSHVNAAAYQVNGGIVLAVLPGAGSLGVGADTGRLNTGAGNTFVGNQAGYANTTGTGNTFMGVDAGRANTTANGSTFVGIEAGYSNTTGAANSFVGDQAGRSNTTGNWNVFMGYQTGYNNTTGTSNSFVGMYAGIANTTGDGNSLFGYQVGQQNQTGSANAIFGGYAGGPGSGGPNSFSSSTIMGYRAGYGLTTGSDNILLGFQAGDNLTTGSRNIVIGYDQNATAPTISNELNIGGLIWGRLQEGLVGIGFANTLPQAALDVRSTFTATNAQIWRDETGTAVATMTSSGHLFAKRGMATGIQEVNLSGAMSSFAANGSGLVYLNQVSGTNTITSITGCNNGTVAQGQTVTFIQKSYSAGNLYINGTPIGSIAPDQMLATYDYHANGTTSGAGSTLTLVCTTINSIKVWVLTSSHLVSGI